MTEPVSIAETEAAARYHAARVLCMVNAIGRLSHDLRGVLSPALLAAERLLASPEASVRRGGEIVVRAVDRATDVIRSALETARDGVPPIRVRATLRDLVETETLIYEAGEVVIGEIDPAQLAEALATLCEDARSRGARTIRLGAEPGAGLMLTDDGEIPSGEPFQPHGGAGAAGYARATARELVRAQGGEVTLGLSASGGNTVRIMLPAIRLGG